jgi:HNH endonuclease
MVRSCLSMTAQIAKNKVKKRRAPPRPTVREVLTESGFMCANPRCRSILTLEIHHIEWVRDDGGNDPANLIALCSNCHTLHTRGQIPRQAIETWKQMLMLVNNALDRDSLDLLLFLYRHEAHRMRVMKAHEKWEDDTQSERDRSLKADTPLRKLWELDEKAERSEPERPGPVITVGGDGLLRLARLINAGLVETYVDRADDDGPASPTHWVPTLTKLGRNLARAWTTGNVGKFREAIRGASEPHGDDLE